MRYILNSIWTAVRQCAVPSLSDEDDLHTAVNTSVTVTECDQGAEQTSNDGILDRQVSASHNPYLAQSIIFKASRRAHLEIKKATYPPSILHWVVVFDHSSVLRCQCVLFAIRSVTPRPLSDFAQAGYPYGRSSTLKWLTTSPSYDVLKSPPRFRAYSF